MKNDAVDFGTLTQLFSLRLNCAVFLASDVNTAKTQRTNYKRILWQAVHSPIVVDEKYAVNRTPDTDSAENLTEVARRKHLQV